MNARSYELIVFDWDGTLMDSTHVIAASLRSACADVGVPVPTEADARFVIGLGLEDTFNHVAPGLDADGRRRLSERYRHHFLAREGQAAHTVFRLERNFSGFSLLEAELKTGRTHQIRVHLAHLKHPVLGDAKYGDFELNKRLRREGLHRMFLHAARLAFEHPETHEGLVLESPLPADLDAFRMSHMAQEPG